MKFYRLAGQDFYLPDPLPELAPFEKPANEQGTADVAVPFISPAVLQNEEAAAFPVPAPLVLICHTVGWVAGEQRPAETWSAPPGILVRVAGGSDFYISPGGRLSCAQAGSRAVEA